METIQNEEIVAGGEVRAAEKSIEKIEIGTESGLEDFGGKRILAIDESAEKAIASAEQGLKRANDLIHLSPTAAEEVAAVGGFRSKLAQISNSIRALAASAKGKILGVLGKAPPRGKTEGAVAPETNLGKISAEGNSSERESESVPSEKLSRSEAEKQGAQVAETEEDAREKKERELNEYLEREVFLALGIDEGSEKLALAEAPREKREILERSFRNIREKVRDFHVSETLWGRVDGFALKADKRKSVADFLTPNIQEVLARHGFGDRNLDNLAADYKKDPPERDPLYRVREEMEVEEKKAWELVEGEVWREVWEILDRDGRWGGLEAPKEGVDFEMEDGVRALTIEYSKRIRAAIAPEANRIFLERQAGEGAKNFEEAKRALMDLSVLKDRFIGERALQHPEKNFRVWRSREEVTQDLSAELEKVRSTSFPCINITPNGLQRVLAAGSYKALAALSESERESHFSQETLDYLKYREEDERAIGIYNSETPPVYGTLAMEENSTGEYDREPEGRYGGAPMYGDIFLKLKPAVIERSTFLRGDLMDLGPTIAPKEQVAPSHAYLLKALREADRRRMVQFGWSLQMMDYVEAQITGGVSADDIESINVPREIYENAVVRMKSYSTGAIVQEGNPKEVIDRLLADPKWKDKINLV